MPTEPNPSIDEITDQDIDIAGTEADRLTAGRDPNQDRQDRNVEEPGDTGPDIVGRAGEQMPRQRHDGLEDDEERG